MIDLHLEFAIGSILVVYNSFSSAPIVKREIKGLTFTSGPMFAGKIHEDSAFKVQFSECDVRREWIRSG